ncbi:MAG: hypothetical protein IIZ39_00835, partial [Blautia sp.]|nr:hypothetical protein [Blautia sp.]
KYRYSAGPLPHFIAIFGRPISPALHFRASPREGPGFWTGVINEGYTHIVDLDIKSFFDYLTCFHM